MFDCILTYVSHVQNILYTERILIAGSVGTMNWKECPGTLSAMLMIALTSFMKGISLVYSLLILDREIKG